MTTWTDLFCGAGGSSTGIVGSGARVVIAANHWDLAVDVHNANHPTTDHATADIHEADPRYFPRTDCLWASPECTRWTVASGRRAADIEPGLWEDPLSDEAGQRSRMLMFDVPRFAEVHRYRSIVVENVVDVATRPKYRHAFQIWLREMGHLGYDHRVISLNSMHAQAGGLPAPQSRDRLYVVFWRRGDRSPELEQALRPQAWCDRCETVVESRQAWKPGRTVGKYRQQYVYVCSACGRQVEPGWLPAAYAIDWALPGRRIGDRDKPLAVKTRARIAAGIARYWRPFTLEAAGHTFERRPGVRTWPVDQVLTALHTTASKALAVPVEGRNGLAARAVDEPFRTQTTRLQDALLTVHRYKYRTQPVDEPAPTFAASGNHVGLVQSPFVMTNNHHNRARGVDESFPTLTTATVHGLVAPFIAELRGGRSDARAITDPLATFAANGNHHALVAPYYGGSSCAQPVTDPLGTVSTRDHHALIMRNNTARGDQGQMLTPADEVMRTLTTAGHQSLVTPGDLEAAQAQVDDCLFRMLEPHEVAAGMAFPADYVWQGNRRERVKLAGNAVTPPAARDLVAAVEQALEAA